MCTGCGGVARHLPGVLVWAIDADGIVVRSGPRLLDEVEAIAWILHPDAVPTQHLIGFTGSHLPADALPPQR
jgi:hypothetical protein